MSNLLSSSFDAQMPAVSTSSLPVGCSRSLYCFILSQILHERKLSHRGVPAKLLTLARRPRDLPSFHTVLTRLRPSVNLTSLLLRLYPPYSSSHTFLPLSSLRRDILNSPYSQSTLSMSLVRSNSNPQKSQQSEITITVEVPPGSHLAFDQATGISPYSIHSSRKKWTSVNFIAAPRKPFLRFVLARADYGTSHENAVYSVYYSIESGLQWVFKFKRHNYSNMPDPTGSNIGIDP